MSPPHSYQEKCKIPLLSLPKLILNLLCMSSSQKIFYTERCHPLTNKEEMCNLPMVCLFCIECWAVWDSRGEAEQKLNATRQTRATLRIIFLLKDMSSVRLQCSLSQDH
jgi:hypothetical protein